MSIDRFIALLKELGVSAASVEEVRAKLAANHLSIKFSLDKGIGDADEHPVLHVSGNSSGDQADVNESTGEYSARVLRERQGAVPVEPDSAALPTNYEEAKAIVPGLRKWVRVKAEALAANPGRPVYDILVEHLRNPDTGLGKWTTREGFPKRLLRKIDESLRQEILGSKALPSDIKLLDGNPGRPRSTESLTSEQVREARRIASLGSRRGI